MASITVTELKSLIAEDQNLVLIDVRTESEIADGIIPGALWMNVYDKSFMSKAAELPKDKTYCLYCASGGRTMMTMPFFEKSGFTRAFHLEGGITAWLKAGGEIA